MLPCPTLAMFPPLLCVPPCSPNCYTIDVRFTHGSESFGCTVSHLFSLVFQLTSLHDECLTSKCGSFVFSCLQPRLSSFWIPWPCFRTLLTHSLLERVAPLVSHLVYCFKTPALSLALSPALLSPALSPAFFFRLVSYCLHSCLTRARLGARNGCHCT